MNVHVRKDIETRVGRIDDEIEWVKADASRAAQVLSTSDERIKELVEVRAAWQELLDA